MSSESPTKSKEVVQVVEAALRVLVRQRKELRGLWRRFEALGEMNLARGLLLIPGKGLTEGLEIIERTLREEGERRKRQGT